MLFYLLFVYLFICRPITMSEFVQMLSWTISQCSLIAKFWNKTLLRPPKTNWLTLRRKVNVFPKRTYLRKERTFSKFAGIYVFSCHAVEKQSFRNVHLFNSFVTRQFPSALTIGHAGLGRVCCVHTVFRYENTMQQWYNFNHHAFILTLLRWGFCVFLKWK